MIGDSYDIRIAGFLLPVQALALLFRAMMPGCYGPRPGGPGTEKRLAARGRPKSKWPPEIPRETRIIRRATFKVFIASGLNSGPRPNLQTSDGEIAEL